MKSLDEALKEFKVIIHDYQETCKENAQVLSNFEAFLKNLSPFGRKKYGGRDGYNRAERLLEALNKQHFENTSEFLVFLSQYINEGTRFKWLIRDFICEAAGFVDEHMRYLANKYQMDDDNEIMYSRSIEFPNYEESYLIIQDCIINIIINGFSPERGCQRIIKYANAEETDFTENGVEKLLELLNNQTNNAYTFSIEV